jgi:hypothetical protein
MSLSIGVLARKLELMVPDQTGPEEPGGSNERGNAGVKVTPGEVLSVATTLLVVASTGSVSTIWTIESALEGPALVEPSKA